MKTYLYLEVADQLQGDIDAGVYGVHQKLPSENDLAARYQTSRLTIRKAVDVLEKRQVVVKDRNRGTYALATTAKISSGATGLAGFTEVAKSLHLEPTTQVLKLHVLTTYPKAIKAGLRLETAEPVWQIERLRLVDREPMTHEQIYIPRKLLPELTATKAQGSLYDLIETHLAIAYASQELEAIQLDEPTAKLLTVAPGSAAFLAHTIAFSVDGFPILYDDSNYRSDKYTFHNILYRHH
ncbi:GntR family transcriptional regulator, LSA1692 subfamily [Lactiplantibacillus nangangensis]|uniref:GntR family transcriptional regulator, LSA1692 subfamily n=1 Tax=Lactiplantibacillus nangangensis TaxID=2559917 RepID=A0ABW1SF49_9LACO|nr:GntR family transcriptional regulator, LSA1692 subfamily [Lactiplantibacillus nangangensis]